MEDSYHIKLATPNDLTISVTKNQSHVTLDSYILYQAYMHLVSTYSSIFTHILTKNRKLIT